VSGPRLYLAGLSGAGKSTVAGLAAGWLGIEAVDVDLEVERAAGRSVAELWAEEGEAAFRAAERAVVERLTERPGAAVVALGGGTLEDADSRERLARWGRGVLLDAPVDTLAVRAAERPGLRPLLDGADPAHVLARLADERRSAFAALPCRVEVDGRPAAAVAVAALRAATSTALETIVDDPATGRVALGRNALAAAGGTIEALGLAAAPRVVVTDATVWALHGAALEAGLEPGRALPCVLPPGEAAKDPDGLAVVWRALLAAGADRDATLSALGGGAIGDLAGLAAATWKRGVPLALFPTTLLAQVDAAIGGKNAIDLGGIKNAVGTFHAPALVLVDPLCLPTLPPREARAGWAEVVKAGLIGDPELFDLCRARAAELLAWRLDVVEEAIARAIRVKADVVRADPHEAGRRRVLNLGHTLGHAAESAAGGALLHGEAVAIGLAAAARLAESHGTADRGVADAVVETLAALGLPTRLGEGLRADDLAARARHDKKRSSGTFHAVLPRRPGDVRVAALTDDELAGWIEREVAR